VGPANGVPVFSDECYVEFTWDGRRSTILQHGSTVSIAVHSLSKRSNLAGVRVGFYAGDAELVGYLQEVRKHVGMLVPGRRRPPAPWHSATTTTCGPARPYRRRLERFGKVLSSWSGVDVPFPAGGFYLWFDAGDGWEFAERLAARAAPGEPRRLLRCRRCAERARCRGTT
jgi:aspartate/methionine/tyrosine aminotransferase